MRVFPAGSGRKKNDGSAGNVEEREPEGRRTNDSYFRTHKSDLDRWPCQDDILIVKMGHLGGNGAFFRNFPQFDGGRAGGAGPRGVIVTGNNGRVERTVSLNVVY